MEGWWHKTGRDEWVCSIGRADDECKTSTEDRVQEISADPCRVGFLRDRPCFPRLTPRAVGADQLWMSMPMPMPMTAQSDSDTDMDTDLEFAARAFNHPSSIIHRPSIVHPSSIHLRYGAVRCSSIQYRQNCATTNPQVLFVAGANQQLHQLSNRQPVWHCSSFPFARSSFPFLLLSFLSSLLSFPSPLLSFSSSLSPPLLLLSCCSIGFLFFLFHPPAASSRSCRSS